MIIKLTRDLQLTMFNVPYMTRGIYSAGHSVPRSTQNQLYIASGGYCKLYKRYADVFPALWLLAACLLSGGSSRAGRARRP